MLESLVEILWPCGIDKLQNLHQNITLPPGERYIPLHYITLETSAGELYIALHLLHYNRNPIIIITGFCIHNMTLQSRNHHHEVSCGVTLRYITLQIYIYYITLQYIHYIT